MVRKQHVGPACMILLLSMAPHPAPAQEVTPNTPTRTGATPDAPLDESLQRDREEALAAYEQIVDTYLNSDWDKLDELTKTIRQHMRWYDSDQRENLTYIQRNTGGFRPRWWDKCASTSNISFKAELWNRPLTANYMPTRAIGAQAVQAEGRYRKNRQGEYEPHITQLSVIVTWKPGLVNSSTPGTGRLAEIHEMRLGDLSEVIVWHELGHCYITNYLPLDHVVELYNNYGLLFSHLQEFYADLTALYHAGPRARRFALMLRLDGLDHYDESEEHARASHAIGSLLLLTILQNPDDWPSFHFPPAVPKQQVELNTVIYLYEHMDPKWSLKEARALRDLAGDFINKSGEKTLRARGVAPLPGDLKFSLMAADDHDHQAQRDAYVAEKLKSLIESGRADKVEDGETYDPPIRRVPSDGEIHKHDKDALRIDLPM